MDTPRPLSALLEEIDDRYRPVEEITVGSLLEAFHERGFGFFLFLISLPAAIPIPAPGLNAVVTIPMLLLTAQQALGFHAIWLPQSLKRRTFKVAPLHSFITKTKPLVRKLEIFFRPRLAVLTQGVFSHLIGVTGFIMALFVAFPMPLTNTVPSIGMCLLAIGVLMRDGLAVLVGAVVGLAWCAMLVLAFIFFGVEGFVLVKEWIKSFI